MNTTKDKRFYLFYGYIEVGVDVLSGLFMLFATQYFIGEYLHGIHFPHIKHALSIQFMVRSFGYMVLMSGLMQFVAINYGSQTVRRYFLIALMSGDAMQLIISGLFFYKFQDWDLLLVFNFVFTFFLFVSRLIFVIYGVPENTRYPSPQ